MKFIKLGCLSYKQCGWIYVLFKYWYWKRSWKNYKIVSLEVESSSSNPIYTGRVSKQTAKLSEMTESFAQIFQQCECNLIVVRAVCGLLHWCILLFFSNFHTNHRVHVQTNQLTGLDYCNTDLKDILIEKL